MAYPHSALIEIAAMRPPPPSVDDPEHLLATALDHRMQGLLWSAVMRGEIELPLETEHQLAVLDLRTQAHHRKLWDTLEEVVARLAEIGVEVAAFKGVTAEARWYRRTGERPSWDIDLWLSPHQLDRIDEVVDLLYPEHPLSGRVRGYEAGGFVQSVDLEMGGVQIDLHFDPIKIGIPVRELPLLWETTEEISGVRVMSEAGSLLVAGMHLLKDRFAQLGPAEEFVRLVARAPTQEVSRIASSEGLDRWLAWVAATISQDLGVDVAMEVDPIVRIHVLGRMGFARSSRFAGQIRLSKGTRAWFLVPISASGRLQDGLAWILRKLRPPPDLAAYNLTLLRGSWFFRAIRGAQLSLNARRRNSG